MKKLLLPCFLVAIFFAGFTGLAENANAQTTTLIHYWNFNTLAGPYTHPNIPNIVADYTVLTPADSAYLEYYLLPGTSATWAISGPEANNASGAQIDNVTGDTTNARMGDPAGTGIRFRNPTDSCELHWHIPSTGFTNLVLKFATQTSSIASGDSAQIYSYSVDGGKTWDSTGMTVNGAPGYTLDLTQGGNANSIYLNFAPVTITFGSNTAVNNNPKLIFRIIFRGNTHPNMPVSGNNRFDNLTLDGVGSSGPPPPPPAKITLSTPEVGNILIPGQQETISFTTQGLASGDTIKFSTNGGTSWSTIGTTPSSATSYAWTVPNVATEQGLIEVVDSGITAVSGLFPIYPITSSNLIVHYWDFNTLFGKTYNIPNIPPIPADFSATSAQGMIVYDTLPGISNSNKGYLDNVAGDTTTANDDNLFGEPLLGPDNVALRVRNPTDSMDLRFVLPTTGYSGISFKYSLQSSSLTGPQREFFTYNSQGFWTSTGITVNGVVQDSLDVTQSQYQGANNGQYGLVTIGFTAAVQAAISNNPNFQFRIIFGDTATGGTSGNNRFDNFTVLATSQVTNGVTVPVQAQQQLDISPNPAGDEISFANPFASQIAIAVIDQTGREVLQSSGTGASTVNLDISTLASGAYYVRIQNVSNGNEQLAKFIKQ